MIPQRNEYDVVVIGGGIAGLVASNRAAELGLRVTVLEKGGAAKYLCNSRYTGGTFHISYNDVGKPAAELEAAIHAATDGFSRKDVAKAIATDGIRLVKWLQGKGVRFMNLGQYHTYVLAPPSRTGPGLDWEGRAGDVMIDTLEQRLKAKGFAIARGRRAYRLTRKENGLLVEADVGGVTESYAASAVVIADGGYSSNLELISDSISRQPHKLQQRNARTAVGDGLMMAQSVGAAVINTSSFYGHLLSRDAFTNDKLWPRPYVDALAVAGILVDENGKRFADEGTGGVPLANAVAQLSDPLAASLIIDQAIWDGPGTSPMIPANPHLPNVGGTMHRAETVADLALRMGVDPHQLVTTVTEYNSHLKNGTLHELSPPRRSDKHKPFPIIKAPFYAIPLCAGITNTMGGVVVDGNGAVQDQDGHSIPGLFAAGATTGGLEGGPNTGYVGGLIKAVLGLRAAEEISRTIQ